MWVSVGSGGGGAGVCVGWRSNRETGTQPPQVQRRGRGGGGVHWSLIFKIDTQTC